MNAILENIKRTETFQAQIKKLEAQLKQSKQSCQYATIKSLKKEITKGKKQLKQNLQIMNDFLISKNKSVGKVVLVDKVPYVIYLIRRGYTQYLSLKPCSEAGYGMYAKGENK